MSCHGCASKYGFFNKESGCPNCGFSYCSKCLKFKAVIPKLGNTEQIVCKSCYQALTDLGAKSKQQDHPAAFLQRLESLENPARPPITVYQHDQRMQQLKTGLTQTDREIADRLEKLREDRRRDPLPSEDEIAKRLALLKGEDPLLHASSSQKQMVTDNFSQQQQADNLIRQFEEEHQLKLKHLSPEEDIASRLAQLRGLGRSVGNSSQDPNLGVTNPTPPEISGGSGNDDESNILSTMSLAEANTLLAQLQEEEKSTVGEHKEIGTLVKKCLTEVRSKLTKKSREEESDVLGGKNKETDSDDEAAQQVIQQVMDEAALEEKMDLSDCSDDSNYSNEEVPWCVICDKNATLKCRSCSGDLYCDSCFKEGHTDFDMKDHKAMPYIPPEK